MTPETVTLDGVMYRRETENGEIRIVTLPYGNVMVGRYVRDGDECELHDASVIRYWGTKSGLGEIAESGPTSSTKLDSARGTVRFHRNQELFTLTCREDAWKDHLR